MPAEKKRNAKKLHIQFVHASKDRLLKLIPNARLKDELFKKEINNACDECGVYENYKKASLKPIVGLSLAKVFNCVVWMDLKEYVHNKKWILHLIDSSARYSAVNLIYTRKDEEVVKNIYLM